MFLAAIVLSTIPSAPQPEASIPQPEASFLAELLPILPAATLAADSEEGFDFSYTYVELGFGFVDVDDFDDESETLYGRASLGLFDFLYAFLDYQNQSTDFNDTDTDLFGVGAGVHFDLGRFDLVGEAAWLTADVESDLANLDDSNDGWMAFAGGRWLALPVNNGGLELNGGYRQYEIDGVFSDDGVGAWEAGARYHFSGLLSIGTKYQFLEDDSFWGVDARISF